MRVLCVIAACGALPATVASQPFRPGRPVREDASGLGAPSPRAMQAAPTTAARRTRYPRTELRLFIESTALLDLGARVRVVLARHVLLDFSSGVGAYGRAYASLARRMGAGDAAPLLSEIANGVGTVHARLGLRPCSACGLELMVGVGCLRTEARLQGSMLASVMGEDSAARVDLSLTLRVVDVELAWAAPVGKRFFLRPAIGFSFIRRGRLATTATSSAPEDAASAGAGSLLGSDGGINLHGGFPTLALALGVRLRSSAR